MKKIAFALGLLLGGASLAISQFNGRPHVKPESNQTNSKPNVFFIEVAAQDKFQRTQLSNLGLSIEEVFPNKVEGFASPSVMKRLESNGFRVSIQKLQQHKEKFLFDRPDAYHDYPEVEKKLIDLEKKHSQVVELISIGKSHEGRDLLGLKITSDTTHNLLKPAIVFVGAHHAREHLSVEIPLRLAEYLAKNYSSDSRIKSLVDENTIYVFPMLNPDGYQHDVSGGNFKFWRKNRRDNQDGTFGVDLNRNYDARWGMGGSSTDSTSDVYMGPAPFSEPETKAFSDFVLAHSEIEIILSYHTFSELILYPWGGKYDSIQDKRDLKVFETMAKTMSRWNGYKPQQSSDLYVATGDTCDWAYSKRRIFCFTFELYPKNRFGLGLNGFYPGDSVIQKVFDINLEPALYLIENTKDPYAVL